MAFEQSLGDRIRRQAEFYFSMENMTRDSFLLEMMNGRMMVPLKSVAQFKKMKLLTDKQHLVQQALFDSPKLYLEMDPDGKMMIGPYAQASPRSRCTIVLNNVPKGVTREDIQSLVAHPILHVFVFPDSSWNVTFETDKVCKEVFFSIQGLTLGNQPIQARIKVDQQQPQRPPPIQPWMAGLAPIPMTTMNSVGYVSKNPVAGHPVYVGGTPNRPQLQSTAPFSPLMAGMPFPTATSPMLMKPNQIPRSPPVRNDIDREKPVPRQPKQNASKSRRQEGKSQQTTRQPNKAQSTNTPDLSAFPSLGIDVDPSQCDGPQGFVSFVEAAKSSKSSNNDVIVQTVTSVLPSEEPKQAPKRRMKKKQSSGEDYVIRDPMVDIAPVKKVHAATPGTYAAKLLGC